MVIRNGTVTPQFEFSAYTAGTEESAVAALKGSQLIWESSAAETTESDVQTVALTLRIEDSAQLQLTNFKYYVSNVEKYHIQTVVDNQLVKSEEVRIKHLIG